MKHYRMMLLIVRTDIFSVKTLRAWKLIVKLNCSALPLTAKSVNKRELKFRSVECAFARLNFIFHSC